MDNIRAAFSNYFKPRQLTLPNPIPEKGRIEEEGWYVGYALNKDETGASCLDFFAEHRMTNSRCVRILQSGESIELESYWDELIYDSAIEGDKERAEQEYREHNEKVSRILQEKGLL